MFFSQVFRMAAQRSIQFLIVSLLLLHAEGLRLGQWGTLVSLSHSLMSRVANARAARGDGAGADRAMKIAENIRRLGSVGGIWSAGWDFAWSYAWRGGFPATEVRRSAVELTAALAELYRLRSAEERTAWVLRNYPRLMDLTKSLLGNIIRFVSRSGPLREAVLMMQKEVLEGELLRDCLEVGAADLGGLVKVAMDMFSSSSSYSEL